MTEKTSLMPTPGTQPSSGPVPGSISGITRDQPKPHSDTLDAARALLPNFAQNFWQEKKANYLAYRYTGFSVREATELAGIHEKTIRTWRHEDPQFGMLEEAATGPDRAVLRREILYLLFIRNLQLVDRKDYEVLRKALALEKDSDGEPLPMTRDEVAYLNRARQHYTPQQLEVLEKRMDPTTFEKPFSFADFIITLRRTTEEVRLEAHDGSQTTQPEAPQD